MKKIVLLVIIASFIFSEENRDLGLILPNNNRDCDTGYIQECTGDGDCCPEYWLGDGYCDNGNDCNLECYYFDEGDCGTPGCGPGMVSDCSDLDCCDALWLDDGICDGEDQARGCDLSCYLFDGWDCQGDPTAGNNLSLDCYSCYGYSITAGISCYELLTIDVFMPSNLNCYVCDEVFNCYGYCGTDEFDEENMPAYECCDNSLACYESECENVFDECGLCGGDSTGPNTGVQDCAGICWGDSEIDCLGVCGGSAQIDECGVCNGSGIQEGACDCNGLTLDSCGICGGDNLADAGCGCFEPPPDICGECDGDGLDCNNDGIDDACEDEFNLGTLSGDVNGDGVLNILDMVIFVDMILNN